ncbi:rod shape-determining protein RodA [Gracilimonas tropica]|uniref:rod shape-determining protein RodA n=1 Tax=Gracilimonas tropica TaxID=454600 RepID=UPI000371D081|nr:rod shape-determining protein RodA [Gracilimonas tropica]
MNNLRELSWSVIFTWVLLATMGLIAIYSATQGPVSQFLPEYIQNNFYKQVGWVAVSVFIMIGILIVPPRNFVQLSYVFYAFGIILMILTLLFGREVNGAKSWIGIGPFGGQSSEIMKVATILAAANYLTSRRNISAENVKYALTTVAIILIPTIIVILQNDLGTALIFLTLIPVMLFWSGLPYGVSLFIISPAVIAYLSVIEWYYGAIAAIILSFIIFLVQRRVWLTITSLITGLLTISGIQLALTQLLQPHQIARIAAFTNPSYDPTGAGWNVIQAKTAIGSGGLTGKGFLEGTQTQLKFLPEQWTDFVFCVIGEEFGFIGATIVIVAFLFLFVRLLNMAGNHKHPFAQLFIVSVTAVFFTHFFINVGSASALLPVIGLPLPFISYGGSAFIVNTVMLGICLNMDFHKREFSIYR